MTRLLRRSERLALTAVRLLKPLLEDIEAAWVPELGCVGDVEGLGLPGCSGPWNKNGRRFVVDANFMFYGSALSSFAGG